MTHVGRSYWESTSLCDSADLKAAMPAQLCSWGGCGKSLGVGGKMPPILPRGLKKHADYSVRNDLLSFCEQLSVAW